MYGRCEIHEVPSKMFPQSLSLCMWRLRKRFHRVWDIYDEMIRQKAPNLRRSQVQVIATQQVC